MVNRKVKQQRRRDVERSREEQAQQQIAARVNALMIGTNSTIYASLVAKEWDGDEGDIPEEILVKLVKLASKATTVWAQSIGLIQKPPQPELKPEVELPSELPESDDSVVEIPQSSE